MSSVSIEGRFAHLRHLFGRLGTTADRPPPPARPMADLRIAVTVTLLLVITTTAATWPRSPRPGAAAAKPEDAAADAAAVPAGPVRIVGASPRGDNCSEQVWPYIERRCLTRAHRPQRQAQAAAPEAGAAAGAGARERATVGAAPGEPILPQRDTGQARSRVATAHLAMPRPRFDPMEPVLSESASDGLRLDEPPRRRGRRAHRFRHRHHGGGFFFPFRF